MFIVQAREMKTMRQVYYTGRAGEGWLSPERREAFAYATEGEADRKSRMFQRQNMGRYVFMVDHASPDDAHAAGARAMSEEACGR